MFSGLALLKNVICLTILNGGGVEDVRLEAKANAKNTKKSGAKDSPSKDKASQGQGQEFLRPRPRTKDTGASVLRKKKKNFFQAILKKTIIIFKSSKDILLVLEFCIRGFYVQAYAVDLAVLVTGADMLWI